MNNDFLNYSDGHSFCSLCKEILAAIENGYSVKPFALFVNSELTRLVVNRSIAWGRTVSQRCYYKYLTELNNLLADSVKSDSISSLAERAYNNTRDKIHILFLTQEESCWPSLESVFKAAEDNKNYHPSLVYTPFEHKNFTEKTDYFPIYHDELNLPIIRHNKYDLVSDSPDIAVMIKPYGNVPAKYTPNNIIKSVQRIVYIPYGMEITTDLIKFGFQFYLHDKAWKHCVYGQIVKDYATKFGYQNGENVVVWGHPKADHYLTEHEPSQRLKNFIAGRKAILWSPHHLINLEESGTGTWLIWGKEILNIALNSPDIAFIFRPHPLMMGALVNGGYISQREAEEMKNLIKSSSNILWDDGGSYIDDFYAADAIITDGTTFSIEFLYTGKPIILTPRNMSSFYAYDQMMESYYIVNNVNDVRNYIDMVRKGEDPLQSARLKMRNEMFYLPKGKTVGENIMENIKTELDMECETEAKKYIDEIKDPASAEANTSNIPALFSILVLTYKNQSLLYGMLDSIFKQDYPRIQLIVSDDGSGDFDAARVEDYIRKNAYENIVDFRVLENPENLGTVKHINKAMQAVDGEYFVFTAADDRFNGSCSISRYAEEFESNSDCGWIVAKARITTADYKRCIYTTPTEKDIPYFTQSNPLVLYSRNCRRGMYIPCSMAFRKSTFEKVGGFDLRYTYIEDWPLDLRLLRLGYMPSFLNIETAIHSAGGITNTNTYGFEPRRKFLDDKKMLLNDEPELHPELLQDEDKKALKKYRHEILDRQYFFLYLEMAKQKGKAAVFSLLLSNPNYLFWFIGDWYMRNKGREIFKRKKMFVVSQVLFLLSMLFELFSASSVHHSILIAFSAIDFWIGIALIIIIVLSFFLKMICSHKEKLRKDLVN